MKNIFLTAVALVLAAQVFAGTPTTPTGKSAKVKAHSKKCDMKACPAGKCPYYNPASGAGGSGSSPVQTRQVT